MGLILLAVIIAFFCTYYAIPVILHLAETKKLYDEPDSVRKLHKAPIPSLGGLGIFIGFSLSILLSITFVVEGAFQYYTAAFLLIFFIGLKDDILAVAAMKKLIGQVAAAAILIFGADLTITNMHGFLGIYQLDNTISYILTIFTIVVTINAFNLIDGVDGLAGSISLISCLVFGIFFLINGNTAYATMALSFAASMFAFLIYNYHPAKIFMGDTGSLLSGVVNSILVIKFIQTGNQYTAHPVMATPAVGFSILLLPLMDTLRVFGYRILRGRSPFSPDRNHLHHLLLDKGLKSHQVTIVCACITALFCAAGFLMQSLGTTIVIAILIATFYAGIFWLYSTQRLSFKRWSRSTMVNAPEVEETPVAVVSIFSSTAKAGSLNN